jgi:hypothetical protein
MAEPNTNVPPPPYPYKDTNCYENLLNYNKIMLWILKESVSLGLIHSIDLPVTQSPNGNYNLNRNIYLDKLGWNNQNQIQNIFQIIIEGTLKELDNLFIKVNEYNKSGVVHIIFGKQQASMDQNLSSIRNAQQQHIGGGEPPVIGNDGFLPFTVEFNKTNNPGMKQTLANFANTFGAKKDRSERENIKSYEVGLFIGPELETSQDILNIAKYFNNCKEIWKYIYNNTDLPERVKIKTIKDISQKGIKGTLKSTLPEFPVSRVEGAACGIRTAANEAAAEPSASKAAGPKARLREAFLKATAKENFDRRLQKRFNKIKNSEPITGGKKSHKKRKGKKVRKTRKGKKIKKSKKVHKIKKARKSRK